MTPSDAPIPALYENYIISGSLNSLMLYNLLTGVYTIVYGGTVYVYMSRAESNTRRCIVLTTISVLYLLAFSNLILQWYSLDQLLLVGGDTRDSDFSSLLNPVLWYNTIFSFFQNMSIVIADGLLIWRCYYVWGRCMKVTGVLCLLLATEFTLSITDAVLYGLSNTYSSTANATLTENILIALTFISMGTTVCTTILIGYKIHHVSSAPSLRIIQKPMCVRYSRIVSTIVESSAVYSLVVVLYAATLVLPPFHSLQSVAVEVSYYIQSLLLIIPGLATTVMVLRLALNSARNADASDTLTHISGLDFDHSQHDTTTANSDGAINTLCIAEVIDHEPVPFTQEDRIIDLPRNDDAPRNLELPPQSLI